MFDDLVTAYFGIILFLFLMSVFHVIIVWFFYRIDSKNAWFAYNYEKLPKFLRIFDKEDK